MFQPYTTDKAECEGLTMTERPANTPSPIGSTEIDFPGSAAAATAVGAVTPEVVVEATLVPDAVTEPVVVVAVPVVATDPVELGVATGGKLLAGMAEVP